MTPQENQLLQDFLAQLTRAQAVTKDPDAQALIARALAKQPDAAYLLVQRALLLEQALKQAQAEIAQLQDQGSSFIGGGRTWNQSPTPAPGAAAMIVAERAFAEKRGLKPLARLVSFGVAAVEPGMFGIGPVPAVRLALERARWNVSTIQRIEINEAFAAIALACLRELGFAEDVVNVEGGSIAHGHAIGATGAVLTTRLLHSMKRDGLKRCVVTLCIGGGQGIALALETL